MDPTRSASSSRVRQFLRVPPKLPYALVVLAAASATLWAFSWPGGPSMGRYVFLLGGWSALGLYWLFRIVSIHFAGGSLRDAWVWWLVGPAIVVGTVGLLAVSAPLRFRVELSLDHMNRFATAVMRDPNGPHPDQVGSFPVARVEEFEGGMRFLVAGTGFLDPYGFAYSQDGRPPRIGEDTYWHLEGPWYVWEESW